MDSWTLQGDSYSFLRSAPRTFSLCHRDGTPNHVEIFDIINVPTQRSAISETTCLCDIFGDDCESPSLSSSPAVGVFVPPNREADGTAAASPLADDLNDSGSYHTAQGSSEGEEGFEDSRERLYSPPLQSPPSERLQSEGEGLSSEHPDLSEDGSPNLEQKSKSPVTQLSRASPPPEALNTGERTSSPGDNSSCTFTQGRVSPSSSPGEIRHSSPSQSPKQTQLEAEPERLNPALADKHISPALQFLNPSPCSELRTCVSSSSTESVNTQSSDFRGAQNSPHQQSQQSSPLPEPTSKDFPLDFTESALESKANLSSPIPSSSSAESHSRETSVTPELKNWPHSPDTQASSPFPERRRVSLPDIFSRGFTPDIEELSHSPELISNPSSAGRDNTATPESQNAGLSVGGGSTVSTPAPRYTPPSPVVSVATPELVENRVSPDFKQTAPSPRLLSPASPVTLGATTPSPGPSPKIRYTPTPTESRSQDSSPVVSYTLSPSPGARSYCSPVEHRHTAPSPEIRITASSPELRTRSASPRSLSSSPHITGISYSIVQPEERDTPPFPELSRLSTPDAEARSRSQSRGSVQSSKAGSTGTPRHSPHTPGSTDSALQPEITLSYQPRYHTPSPQLQHQTLTPEPGYQTPPSQKHQSPSPQHLQIKDLSLVSPTPEQKSPASLSASCRSHYTQPSPPVRSTPESEKFSSGDIIEIQYPPHSAKDVSPSFELDKGDASVFPEIESSSPVVVVSPTVLTSPFLVEEKIESPFSQRTQREAQTKGVNTQDKLSLASSEEKEIFGYKVFPIENHYSNPPIELKSHSPNVLVSKDRSPTISPDCRATSISPGQRPEKTHPPFTSRSPNSEKSGFLKPSCTPELSRRHPSTKVRRENGERLTENMAHRVHRRRTPSPPLTRFTPVHIIAPEKPYRQWQNRSHSPSQVVASSQSGNLNTVVTNRESPDVAPAVNNSPAHCGRLGGQLEMDREMQLEEERAVVRERKGEREMRRERKREERVPEKGEGWQGDASYRVEQVELSFNARNRKGPASRSAAPTSRETRQGLPTVHSCSESSLATRQLQQQQSLLRLASQQDPRGGGGGGGPGRRLHPPTHQNKNSAPGRTASSRPCRSSSSSMGSELDEADDEVKWFTDLAFRSLSSPEVDYLDMYNSSHRSSTNISQPSTQESPAGIHPTCQAYADFRGSAPKLDNDELPFQQPSAYYSDGLDPSRRYELGSFECVDVAVEREDTRKVRRGVPKRQIQLKRKNNADGKQDESSENSSPGIPVMAESPSLESHGREKLLRQHSTPAVTQDDRSECSPEPNQKNERKFKLQKSASLDETCSKTKMATCLIKSVLSKKMQCVDKEPDEQTEDVSPAFDGNSPPIESSRAKESPNPDRNNLSSTPLSDYGLSPECLPLRGEPSTKDESKSPRNFGMRASNRPSSSSSSRSVNVSQTDSEDADSQSRNATALKSEMRSELKVPLDSKQSRTGVRRADGFKIWDEREGGDSANAASGNTGAASATGASVGQAGMTNRGQECENTEDHKQLQEGQEGGRTSKPQEISLRAVEKKKASLNVRLTPEAEKIPEAPSLDATDRVETSVHEKTEEEDERNANNKMKAPIHKVRDVRQLVKNTYNLSFKAPCAVLPLDVNEEKMEFFNEERTEEVKEERGGKVIPGKEQGASQGMRMEERRAEREEEKKEVKASKLPTFPPPIQSQAKPVHRPHPIQIEYKAVCWKEDKNKQPRSKRDDPDDKPQDSHESVSEVSRESRQEKNTSGDTANDKPCQRDLKKSAETQEAVAEMHKMPDKEVEPVVVTSDRKPPMLGSLPKLPSKEREVSTAVVLIRDGSKTSASPVQEAIPTPIQVPAPSVSPEPTPPGSSGHSVSMLLKEKGYQADIGAVVGGDVQNASGGKGPPRKHVNSLEIPLQTTVSAECGRGESHRERTFSSSSTASGPSSVSEHADMLSKTTEAEVVHSKPPIKDVGKQKNPPPPLRNMQEQTPPFTKQKDVGDFEAVKRLDPTFPPRSPAIRRFRPQPIEVKSLSKETQKQEMPANTLANNRPQTIEVKSIAKNSQKPIVPPKPSCKFKPADVGALPSETQRPPLTAATVKPQGEERSQTIVVSSPTIYRKISNESTATSNYTRKLAVSAVSSLKPPPSKTTATAISNVSNQSTAPAETEACSDRGQQRAASPQSAGHIQRPATLAPTSTTSPDLTSAPGPISVPIPSQVPVPTSAGVTQPSQPAVVNPDSRQVVHPRMACPREQTMPVTSNNVMKQPAAVHTTQVPGYARQSYRRSLSGEHPNRADDLRFYASDDPPSYDERESFSPLMLPDLSLRRSNRYQPTSHHPPCSCTAGCPSHTGLTAPHHHRSPHNLTPPAPPHSPVQVLPYQGTQPPLRPHQCRPDPMPLSYQPVSPKSSPLGPSQPPALYQPLPQALHQPPPCPPHSSLMQACTADRPLQPPQHIEHRQAPIHRSPQQQPPGMAAAPYSDPGHSHSPGLPPMDPQYLCGPQSLGPSYGSEYGGDSSSLYSESNYGQAPRRVLLDPETGKYFYIEVPVQPLRKMLFDPETGQYVEVLIPQQAMSHSGLYPPSAAPYPSLHNPNMYAPAPQYMPYAAPPPPAHTQPQPPRYPDASAEATIHPSGPGVSYRNRSGPGSKSDSQNHPPLDQSYLESMYYVPTGMNASPNPTPPDYYHKHPPNLPPTGGKRS